MALINLSNVPGQMISGLSDDILDFVSEASMERYVRELDPDFLQEIKETDNFDDVLTEDQEKYLLNLEKAAIPASTDNQTKKWAQKFKKFLISKNLSPYFEKVPSKVLNDYLRLFYANLKKNDGTFYAPASLICIRAAIHRHLKSPEVNSTFNILNDDQFIRANKVLKAMVKCYLTSNQENGHEYERITNEDMSKLRSYFREESEGMKTVQEECIFNILLHFQLRGRENLRAFTKNSFEFGLLEDGKEFVCIKVPMLQKNVKASLNRKEFENLKTAKMISQQTDRCPVKMLKYYISKLPSQTKDDSLFPGLKKNGTFSELTVLGKDSLGNLMSVLSRKACLSKKYTNHCVRVTGINLMHESGMSKTDIASITGHKDERSVERYIRKNNLNIIRASNILGGEGGSGRESNVLSKRIKKTADQFGNETWEIQEKKKISSDTDKGNVVKNIHLHGSFNNCNFQF